MQDASAEMGACSVGLPDAVPLSGGDVLVTYYTAPLTDQTDIDWARPAVD